MDWLVLGAGTLLLMLAVVTVLTRRSGPTARVTPSQRLRLVPFMLLAGLACLLESVPHLTAMPFTVLILARLVGAVLMLGASATIVVTMLDGHHRDRNQTR